MEILAAAFACVWIGVALYVGRLECQQRRLALRLDELSLRTAEPQTAGQTTAKAA
jgi:CcmD family protein